MDSREVIQLIKNGEIEADGSQLYNQKTCGVFGHFDLLDHAP